MKLWGYYVSFAHGCRMTHCLNEIGNRLRVLAAFTTSRVNCSFNDL